MRFAPQRRNGRPHGTGRNSDRPNDLPHQPQDGRAGIAAGLRVHALADPQRRQRTRRRRRDRPGGGQPAGRLRHRPRRELLRHLARLLQGTLGARHGHRSQTPSARKLLHRHQALELRPLHVEPRSVDGHVPQLVQGVAGRPHRLPAAARRGNGRRNEGVRSTLHRQRHPRLPALRTRGGTHPQSRILLPRRHRGLRPPARGARPLPVGFRADPAQLRRLAPRQGGQHAQHRRRIPLRRTASAAPSRASLRGPSASRDRFPAC